MIYDIHADQKAFLLKSSDLLHWKIGAYTQCDDSDPVYLAEGSLVQKKDGNLTIVYRAAKYDSSSTQPTNENCAYRCDSNDGGETWSLAYPEYGCHNTWSKSWYFIENDGTEVYIYSPGEIRERPGLSWVNRPPGNESWSKPRIFYDSNNRNSYPTLAARNDNGWYAVWDSSQDMEHRRTRICFGKFNVHE